jgi:hypothetical protein
MIRNKAKQYVSNHHYKVLALSYQQSLVQLAWYCVAYCTSGAPWLFLLPVCHRCWWKETRDSRSILHPLGPFFQTFSGKESEDSWDWKHLQPLAFPHLQSDECSECRHNLTHILWKYTIVNAVFLNTEFISRVNPVSRVKEISYSTTKRWTFYSLHFLCV